MKTPRIMLITLAATMALAACGKSDKPLPGGQPATPAAEGAEVTGAGATFIYPLLSKWSDEYHKATGNKINYQSIGSGGGIAQIKAATVDFGSSDKPLSPEELAAAGLSQFPSVIGRDAPVVNVEVDAP